MLPRMVSFGNSCLLEGLKMILTNTRGQNPSTFLGKRFAKSIVQIRMDNVPMGRNAWEGICRGSIEKPIEKSGNQAKQNRGLYAHFYSKSNFWEGQKLRRNIKIPGELVICNFHFPIIQTIL